MVSAVGCQLRGFNSQSQQSTVFQDRLGPTKLGVARVDLVISIVLQGSSFSMCSHKPVWIYRDKHNREFDIIVQINTSYIVVEHLTLRTHKTILQDLKKIFPKLKQIFKNCPLS